MSTADLKSGDLYPPNPAAVPADLTRSTAAAYRRRAWLAVAGLAVFVTLYIALTAWFGWSAYRLIRGALLGSHSGLMPFLAGTCSALLAVFMIKALFFLKRGGHSEDMEITADQQPALFSFLHRLADDAKAPRPHRVYLSARVNAAVFYDLSILNLLLPSKKNLEIGLALVNVLNLSEFKAVLSHEFGHFAQKSMAVGRWVYITQQIAAQIIARRDALDRFISGLSRMDPRIGWVGWILGLIIWSIRSLMETLFRIVILAQRALSREMEFQADLVSVSLNGSDALIHALHKLAAADEAWDRALRFAAGEMGEGKAVRDVFGIQTHLIGKLAHIQADPHFGRAPPVPQSEPDRHRLFRRELAHAPQMWATHPTNADREANAKRMYLALPADEREAWQLFRDAGDLREKLSAQVLGYAKAKDLQMAPDEESLQRLDQNFNKPYLDPRYRSCYLGRSIVASATTPDELYDRQLQLGSASELRRELDALYPETLHAQIRKLSDLEREKAGLEAIKSGTVRAPRGMVHFRGNELPKRKLAAALAEVQRDLDLTREAVLAHDRRVRSVHLGIASGFGLGWAEYLRGLVAILHYTGHSEADVRDARDVLANVFAIVTADGKVSNREREQLVAAASQLHAALKGIHAKAAEIKPGAALLSQLGIEGWSPYLGVMELPPPTSANLGDWLGVIDSWVGSAAGKLGALRAVALEQLLHTEARLAEHVRQGSKPEAAPEASAAAPGYPLLLPGRERKRQTQLGWWDRFQIADGVFPAIVRSSVAGAVVCGVFVVAAMVGVAHVTIYNGLDRPVKVSIDGNTVNLGPQAKARVSVSDKAAHVETRTTEGELIEAFDQDLEHGTDSYVYNVAAATPLVLWTAAYGDFKPLPERPLGSPRWLDSGADVLFGDAPKSISSKSGGGYRTVLDAAVAQSPNAALGYARGDAERHELAAVHARWDALDSRSIGAWFAYLNGEPAAKTILQDRLQQQPGNVLLLRMEQDIGDQNDHERACARQATLAVPGLKEADLAYLHARCAAPGAEQNASFISAYHRWPENPWLALGAGYALATEDHAADATQALQQARLALPPLADSISVIIARLRRSLGDESVQFDDLLKGSPSLQRLLTLESGKGIDDGPMLAYSKMAQGELNDALALAKADADLEREILVLAATSDGAPALLVNRALGLPPEQLAARPTLAWLVAALAVREAADADYRLAPLERYQDENSQLLRRFFQALRRGGSAADQNEALHLMSPDARGFAMSLGSVALGDRAPSGWRQQARRLLFASERPFFR
ncbi:MAG: M48 family metallopeptidase [Solimonas sp.]